MTLLIGLVTGPREVELSVESPVVTVELRLDGRLRPPTRGVGNETATPSRSATVTKRGHLR